MKPLHLLVLFTAAASIIALSALIAAPHAFGF
jgi:hypothetical protein